jgi:hypothetical protein
MTSGPEGLINGLTDNIESCPEGDPFCFGGGCSSHAREGDPQSGPIDPVKVLRKEMGIPEYEDDEVKYHTFGFNITTVPRSIYHGDGSENIEVGDKL